MALGEKAKLYIASDKGYGPNGFPAWGYPSPYIHSLQSGLGCVLNTVYRIEGYFCGVLVFVIFVASRQVTKIHKFFHPCDRR